MDMSRQEYPALLAALKPDQAVSLLYDRVSLINSVNSGVADFLQERRKIEERYAADLRKLARKPQQDVADALGVFQLPWQRIVSGTEDLAQSHETLASKIETDVETPLRQYATKNREMQAISTVQGNLASIAKDLTRAQDKASKVNARGGRKAEDASSTVEDASREWESQAPYVFEQLQALDETRVNHLRDVLTQFQTHEADSVERNRASAESCLNALLNIETADEIKTFAAKVQQGRVVSVRRQGSVAGEHRPSSSGMVPPMPPPPRNHDQRLRTVSSDDRLAPLPDATPSKSKMGGLKRLGTVMSRRKNAAPPPPQPTSEKKKEKSRSFAPFRRGDSSRSFQDLENTGQDLTPVTSQAERTTSQQAPVVGSTLRPDGGNQSNFSSGMNGTQAPQLSPSDEFPPSVRSENGPPPQASNAELDTLDNTHPAINLPTESELYSSPATQAAPAGYELEDSSRNLTIRDQPIQEDASEAQLAMNNMANQLRMQAQSSGMNRVQGSVRGRRDVRNTVFVPGNQEIPGLTPSSGGGLSTVSDSIYASPAATTSNTASNSDLTPTARRSITPGTILEDHTTGSDVNSIHSAQSLTGYVQHPELHESGLNASIVETVSTWFSETGVTKSFVVGEIAFTHNSSPLSTPPENGTIRLQNFQALEKVAANPMFMTPYTNASSSAEDTAGSYTLSFSAIRRPIPTVGLKYQLHLDEANLGQYSPILVTPAWQIVDGQASVIVLYSLNPGFTRSAVSSMGEVTLKNVAISVNLDVKESGAGKPVSAMMAPTQGASFRRKAGSVVWRFSELKIRPEQERLLVRFITEGGVAVKSGVEVKFEMQGVTAGGLEIEKLGVESSTAQEADPFADETEKSAERASTDSAVWSPVSTKKMLIAGRYSAV